jgi:uncharacterized protein
MTTSRRSPPLRPRAEAAARARRWPLRRPLARAALYALLAACALAASAARSGTPADDGSAAQLEDLASFPRASLEIRTRSAKRVFEVWIADTAARSEQGLMFVRDLPASQGMLFIEPRPRVMSMWMKNTFIALDMLFIRADGRIAAVKPRTTPHSLTIISTPEPVKAVLELKGGEAEHLGIEKGDRVVHPAFAAAARHGAAAPARTESRSGAS